MPFTLGFGGALEAAVSLLAAWTAASASCCLRAIAACSMECWDDEVYSLPGFRISSVRRLMASSAALRASSLLLAGESRVGWE